MVDPKIISSICTIRGVWNKPFGLFLALVLASITVFRFFPGKWLIWLIVCGCLSVFWTIQTQRIYFRDRWFTLLWVLVLLAPSLFFAYFIYPQMVQGTIIDFPYIKLCGSTILFLLLLVLLLIIKSLVINSNDLLIILFVVNEKPEVESLVRDSVRKAVDSILNQQGDVRIIVPPFGICSLISSCEKYIRNPFTRADAFIRADVVDGGHNNDLDYVFTKFTSRVNLSRKLQHKNSDIILGSVDEVQKYRDWNYKNGSEKDTLCKIRICDNVESMLRMYVASIYLLKRKYDIALPVVDELLKSEKKDTPLYQQASFILGSAYLLSSQEEEHNKHDYERANKQLQEFITRFPSQVMNNQYVHAMARVQFYLGNIKASKKYTKLIKDSKRPDSIWAYYLNMGFYAIYENKKEEFVNWYKKLYHLCPILDQVSFAIQFLQYEHRNTSNQEYRINLEYAISFLMLYINTRKAKMRWRKLMLIHPDPVYKKLDEMVLSTNKRLRTYSSKIGK